ncbi:MAG: VWA domain-containing protein [Treponemataceae bacterium]|nr:MAG: VWA domain-containing protein [Treponemataceae bacterium]
MKKGFFAGVLFAFASLGMPAQDFSTTDFSVTPDDLRVEAGYVNLPDGVTQRISGYHVFIRKKDGVNSVLLTETTKDPEGRMANYAFRALEWNEINGDEKRSLNGQILDTPVSKYSIIDSTPEVDSEFGYAFHLFIPMEIQYGYSWTRNEVIKIGKGIFVNFRTFGAQYGEYTNGFADNPYMFDFMEDEERVDPDFPPPPPVPPIAENVPMERALVLTNSYNTEAVNSFVGIAKENGGSVLFSRGPDTLVEDIAQMIHNTPTRDALDVVLVLDATGSMKNDIDRLRKDLVPRLLLTFMNFKRARITLVLYRDYGDSQFNEHSLPVRVFQFTEDPTLNTFLAQLNSFRIHGTEGGDVPEAVYEGLFSAMEYVNWDLAAERKIILIGDAEPHAKPRGTRQYTRERIIEMAKARKIIIDCIIIPEDKENNAKN